MAAPVLPAPVATCDPSQAGIDLGTCLRLNDTQNVKTVYDTPASLVNVAVRNVFVIAGFVIFFSIVYAGFKFIQSGSKGKEEAKNIIKTVLIGLVIMFIAYWIVQIVEIIVGQQILL